MFEPDRHPDHPVVAHWQSLVDRGLIGSPQRMEPAVAARILAAEAVLLGRRQAGGVW